jgi:hypothetical protein
MSPRDHDRDRADEREPVHPFAIPDDTPGPYRKGDDDDADA